MSPVVMILLGGGLLWGKQEAGESVSDERSQMAGRGGLALKGGPAIGTSLFGAAAIQHV
jgi:hypothetical protein